MRQIAFLVLAHQRDKWLELIAEQLLDNFDSFLYFHLHRATPEVDRRVRAIAGRWRHRVFITTAFGDFPPYRESTFRLLRQQQLASLHNDVEYAALHDDDQILSADALTRLQRALDAGVPMLFARRMYLWDRPHLENAAMPVHLAAYHFPVEPGDDFPDSRTIHAPARVYDRHADRAASEPHLIVYDVGYLDADERARVWESYRRAGKLDPATYALIEEPLLIDRTHLLRTDPWLQRIESLA